MCESSCKSQSCVLLGLIIGAVFAVAAGLALAFCPWLCAAPVIKYILLFTAVMALILVAIIVCGKRVEGKRSCICNCGKFMLIMAAATVILALISILVAAPYFIFNIVIFALIVFTFMALVTSFIMMLFCCIDNLCDCHHPHHDGCHSNGSHSENAHYGNHTNDYMN